MSAPAPPAPRSSRERRGRFELLLRREAGTDGFVPFDRFMDLALYGESVGFYTGGRSPFGREGDFYTAAHASPLFGRALAERVREVLATLPTDLPASIVEVGPGDGTLAEDILRGLAAGGPLGRTVEYTLVERSPDLARLARERVEAVGSAAGIRVRLSDGIGTSGPFRGVLIANEVLDAQPVRRILRENGTWKETGVRLADGGLARATGSGARPVPGAELPEDVPEGTLFEVSPVAEALVREVADHLTAGVALFIDYGMDEPELVTAHPTGTLAAVRRHRDVGDVLDDPGSSDLSAFVNVRRIRAAARASGLRELAFRPQAEALGAWGLPRLLEEALRSSTSAEAEVRTRLAAKSLMFGFERFFVLELGPAAPS